MKLLLTLLLLLTSSLSYALTWNIQGSGTFTTTADSVAKTGGIGASNIQVIEDVASGDMELNFTMDTTHTADSHFGLDVTPFSAADDEYVTIDYAIRMLFGAMRIRENGSNVGPVTPVLDGDTFAIKVVGTTVTYYRNGGLIYTSLTPLSGYPVKVTGLFTDVGDGYSGVSFPSPNPLPGSFIPLPISNPPSTSIQSKGGLLTSDGSTQVEFSACSDNEVLIYDSAEASGFKCGAN